jgi:apolipoprotein N-acyltransferase
LKFNFFKGRRNYSAVELNEKRKERWLLILSGVLLGISFPPLPFPFPILIFFAFVPYFFVIEKKDKLISVNGASYLTFFVFCLITLYWVGSWQKESDPFLIISGILLLFVNPFILLISSTLFYYSKKIFKSHVVFFLFPFFWVTYEYLYTKTDLHFPWLTLGSGIAKLTSFIQIADIIGTFGISFLIVLINVLFFFTIKYFKEDRKTSILSILAVILIFTLTLFYGFNKEASYKPTGRELKVGLIQPNLDPWEKWETTDLDNLLHIYFSLSKQAINKGAKVIFWPETALPVYLTLGNYDTEVDSIYNFIQKNNVYLLTGMPNVVFYNKDDHPHGAKYDKSLGYYGTYNSILLFSPYSRKIQHYGKIKLVPFGERVPFVNELPFLGDWMRWGVGIGGWNIGRDTTIFKLDLKNKNQSTVDSIKVGGLVCFESVFPIFASHFVNKGAEFLAVVTNDSWYGNLSGPYQHKEYADLRAVENRRFVVRASNGGISCVINPLGQTLEETKMFTKIFLVGTVSLSNQKTFFTEHPYIVTTICLIVSILAIVLFIIIKIKTKFTT